LGSGQFGGKDLCAGSLVSVVATRASVSKMASTVKIGGGVWYANVLLYFVDVVEGFHCQTRKLVRSIANLYSLVTLGMWLTAKMPNFNTVTLLQIKLKMLEGDLSRMIFLWWL
jgi:hypothetical protein